MHSGYIYFFIDLTLAVSEVFPIIARHLKCHHLLYTKEIRLWNVWHQ